MKAIVFREYTIPEIGLRPDAIIMLQKGGEGMVLVLEIVCHETEQYLASKIHAWQQFEGALDYLSNLFKFKIPHFLICTTGEPIDGAVQFNQLIKEIKNEIDCTEKLQKKE